MNPCIQETHAWTTLRYKGLTWHVPEGLQSPLERWLGQRFPIVEGEGTRLLKREPGRCVAAADGWVIKETEPRSGHCRFRFGICRQRGRRAARLAQELIPLGLPTPEPIAWATHRRYGLRCKDYLITLEIQDSELLTARLDRYANVEAERDRTLRLLAELVAGFHRHGYSDRDIKDANILCSTDDPLCLWIIDLDGVRRKWRISVRRVDADLWQLGHSLRCHGWLRQISDTDVFFQRYNQLVPGRLHRRAFPAE
jgi:hypothetical protein